jgi:hypothetical protein
MPALGSWAENAVINALLRGVNLTAPTAWWIALYLTNPTSLDTGTEITTSGGSNYARQPITFGPPSLGAVANDADVTFPIAGTSWGNVAYAAIRSASTGGNLLFYGPLVTPRFITAGDVLKFLTGNVVATVS